MQKIVTPSNKIRVLTLGLCIAGLLAFSFRHDSAMMVNTPADGGKKKTSVKIYPNPSSDGTITISTNDNEGSRLNFYVFDLDCTLIHNLQLKGKEKRTIQGLKKGIYMYDVFKNDESIERGKLIVK